MIFVKISSKPLRLRNIARFFALTVLPELAARRAVAESIDNSLMDVPVASF